MCAHARMYVLMCGVREGGGQMTVREGMSKDKGWVQRGWASFSNEDKDGVENNLTNDG